jgi:drug/metabolite transporter (DMT)-like permease
MSETSNFTFFTILFVAAWIILNSVCQISIKSGIMQMNEMKEPTSIFDKTNIVNILSNKLIILGFGLYLLSTVFWFGAMSKLDISMLSPLGSLVFVLTALLALVFLGEKISPLRWMGIGVIVVGIYLLVKS